MLHRVAECLVVAAWSQLGVPLADQLAAEDPTALAAAARREGEPRRGSVIFHRPHLACARCHEGQEGLAPLGPDLSRIGPETPDALLVESLLDPPARIRAGYETMTVATADGRTFSGIVAEDGPERLILRDPASDEPIVIAKAVIEERALSTASVMPPGQANALASRAEFLHLLAYLRSIADGGPEQALRLRPTPEELAADAPPPETDLDHAGMIADLDRSSFDRGREIYERICAGCHGDAVRPGSMPTSLRFASGTFKNGRDPLALYRTLTSGFGQMPPQSNLVPRQKYDVIHYIREAFLRPSNPTQYVVADRAYLATLPKGSSRGPAPRLDEPWKAMDYGPSLMATIRAGDDGANVACKGIAVRVDPGPGGVAHGRRWMLYDHDTMRLAAAWEGAGFIDWDGILFNGRHEVHPRTAGTLHVANRDAPAWALPSTGTFPDLRLIGRDGRPCGRLPRDWIAFRGLYRHGDRVILAYRVGEADVLEEPGSEEDPAQPGRPLFTRTIEVGPSSNPLTMVFAPGETAAAVVGHPSLLIFRRDGTTYLRIPRSATPTTFRLLMGAVDPASLESHARRSAPPAPLHPLTRGGPRRYGEALETRVRPGRTDRPFALDVLAHPDANPWGARMRFSGLDFFPDGRRLAVCTWDGDVWLVDGLDDAGGRLKWRRIAAGLFQPLGLVIRDGLIHVACRDQIARLHDFNGDDEADFVECFNTDHQVTPSFHEFALDLQLGADGSFYYAKAARHGRKATVPQHGTLLRVTPDGRATDIVATGFRAPNGVLVNPDGTFFVTDQEGHWIPKNRINLVRPGRFYGNPWGSTDVTDPSDEAMEPPVCWITNAFDRSPSEILRIPEGAWGPLGGSLMSLSYGYGKMFSFLHEPVSGGRRQGGLGLPPIPQVPTGLVRGRFGPDGHLYACGLFGWASNQEQAGGLYRVRYNGRPLHVPKQLHARRSGLELTFTDPLDRVAATDPGRYAVKVWNLRRSEEYGSPHIDERPLRVTSVDLSEDGRMVRLAIEGLAPAPGMEVRYSLSAADGAPVEGTIHNTIHEPSD